MRPSLLVAAAVLASGCGTGDASSTGPDAGSPGPMPDLASTCLPAEDVLTPKGVPGCPIEKPASPDRFDELLSQSSLDRCALHYSAGDWAAFGASRHKDPFRLPWYDTTHDFPVNAPPFARATLLSLDAAAASDTPVARTLSALGTRLGAPVAPCLAPFATDDTQPLARAVAQLISNAGGAPDEAALEADAADVPLPLQAALAEVILATDRASADWNTLLHGLSDDQKFWLQGSGGLFLASSTADDFSAPGPKDALAGFDVHGLVDGAVRLAWAIEKARLFRFAGQKGFAFDQRTPLGRIVLRDAADDRYPAGDKTDAILLVVDTGGNDVYGRAVGAVGGDENPGRLGIAIDLAGDDTWGYDEAGSPLDGKRLPSDGDGRLSPGPNNGPISLSETPRQGGARLGYGFVFDYGGDDHYRSLRMSQGAGIAGVGVLYDAAGSDTYEGEAGVQGSATFGVGLLLDAGTGRDLYRTYNASQGFGYVRGAGCLYDAGGDDQYLADIGDPAVGGDPLYYSPQLPKTGNSSFTQGAGFGRRAPGDSGAGDRVFMSGGLGILRDLSGDDRYVTSVFGQGAGYWFGTGILADGAGSDHYDGKWYVQGAAAHGALAVFVDDAGDDQYDLAFDKSPPSATSIGVGHDFSVSWHIDGGGSDAYRAPGLSLGSGYANGMGFFVNLGGDDQYRSAGEPTLGAASIGDADGVPSRHAVPVVGMFLDVGGADRYDAPSMVTRGDDKAWTDDLQSKMDGYSDHGAGLDTANGKVSLP